MVHLIERHQRHGGAAPDGPMMLEAGRTALTAMWRMLDGV
jgi:hypothetical protein